MEEKYINPYTDFGFKKLFGLSEQAEVAKLSPEERFDYEESVKVYRDLINVVETARQKGERSGMEIGLEKGRAEGRAEGMEEAKAESARRMKQKGFSANDISEITGLSKEQIEAL